MQGGGVIGLNRWYDGRPMSNCETSNSVNKEKTSFVFGYFNNDVNTRVIFLYGNETN